MVDLNFFLER